MGCGGSNTRVEEPQPKIFEPVVEEIVVEEVMEEQVAVEAEPEVYVKAEAGPPEYLPQTEDEKKYWHLLKEYPDYRFERKAGDGSFGDVIELRHVTNRSLIKVYA